jgi:hypothetical protein
VCRYLKLKKAARVRYKLRERRKEEFERAILGRMEH